MCEIKKRIKNKNTGYALLEILFYILLFTILSITMTNSLIIMTQAFKATTTDAQLAQGANIMERISREVRQASSINSISASDLKLNTTGTSGSDTTLEFKLLDQNDLQFFENNVLTGNLNTSNVAIMALTFTQITIAKSTAVKIFLTVKSISDSANRTENFYDTVVLRGNYQ